MNRRLNSHTADRLQDIFRVVFSRPSGANVAGLSQSEMPSWDSLVHVSLVTAIESEFGVSLDAADQIRMTSFETVQTLLEDKGL